MKVFEIVTDTKTETKVLPSGHATVVRRQETLSGDIVIKEKKEEFKSATNEEWLEKQINAAQIADEIRAKNNPAYVVPKTFIAHGKVREQFIDGIRWRNLFKLLSPADQEWAFNALAEFVNDMSELRPVKYDSRACGVPKLRIRDSDVLARILDAWDEKYVSRENKKLIQDIYEYLSKIPENKLMVFGHNDLHGDNVIIDLQKRQIAIIDFELSGYKSAYDTMYGGMLDSESFWKRVNMLPRTTNPDLTWDFVREHRDLHKFLSWGYYEIVYLGKSIESMSDIIKTQCDRMRRVFEVAQQKSKKITENKKIQLVHASHYGRE